MSRRWIALLATASLLVGACTGGGGGGATAGAAEDCEDFTFVPCPRQVATVTLPIAGSSFSLRYASDRAPGRKASPSLDARPIGLGGWTIDVLHSYDPAAKVLVLGTGERRQVDATSLTSDGNPALAVAAVDGSEVYVFDAAGRLLHTFDAVTGAERYAFAWSAAGLDSITEPGGRVTRIRRDSSGGPLEIVTARGYRTRLGLRDGRLAAVADPSGHLTMITTNADGLVTVIRDASNAKTVLRYDDAGRLIEGDGPSGAKVILQREETGEGFTVTTTTGQGRTWSDSVEHGGDGKVVRTHRDAAGQATTVEVDGLRRVVRTADGTTVHLQLAPDPRWGLSAPVPQHVESTSPSGRHSTSDETRTSESSTAPNAPGAVQRVVTIDGVTWTIASDPAARSTTITAPDGTTRTTVVDEAGRSVSRAVAGSAPLTYHYDDVGRIDAITAGVGTEARVWRRSYDTATGAVTLTDPAGRTTIVRVDANGRRQSADGPGDLTIATARDEVGRLTAIVPPAGVATRAQYRADGQLDTMTHPSGAGGVQFTTFDYDVDGSVAAVATADGTGTAVHRDGSGRVDQVDAGAGPWHIGYDGTTGMATTFEGPGATLKRQFDGADLTSEAWSGPVDTSVTHRLDPSGRVLGETVAGADEVGYAYDQAGLLSQAGDVKIQRDPITGRVATEVLGSLQRSWAYNGFGEVTAVAVTTSGSAVYDLAIARDGLGRVSSRTEHLPDGVEHTRTFTYDPAGRLASSADDGLPPTTFAYDVNGNLIAETAPDGTTVASTYDGRDALVARGDTNYTYDSAGRLATATNPGGTTTYAYDHAGALLSVRTPSAATIDYVNDATGRRIARNVGGATMQAFAYRDALRPAAELNGAGHVTGRFVYGSGSSAPTYVVRDGATLLVITDDVGTPRLLVDAADGHVAEQLDTDAWGRLTSDTAPGTTPFGFAGGLADRDTGLVRFGARDYDPAARRWTATDPIGFRGGDTNLYRYVGGDPVNQVDPTGLLCDTWAFGMEGALSFGGRISGAVGIVRQGNQGFTWYLDPSTGVGSPDMSVGFPMTCLHDLEPGASDKAPPYSGPDLSVGGSGGIIGVGYDQTYGKDRKVNREGFHFGLEIGPVPWSGYLEWGQPGDGPWPWNWGDPDQDGDAERDMQREAQCIGADAGLPDCNRSPDSPDDNDLCSGTGTCEPDDASKDPSNQHPAEGRNGTSSGEPHLRTVGGQAFDLQAVGEFTALRSDSGDLVIQTRQVPLGGSPALGGSRHVAINAGVAVGINGDKLTFQIVAHILEVRLNGQLIDPQGGIDLPKRGRLTADGSRYLVTWPDQTVLRVFPAPTDINVQLAAGRVGTVHGLLGPDTGAPLKGLEAKDGTKISEEQVRDREILHRTFGDSWRISQEESLFDYGPGESTATFDDRTFPDPTPPPISDSQRAAAERVCKRAGLVNDALAGCIFDVSVTGDATWATTTAAVLRALGPTTAVVAAGAVGPRPAPGAGGGTEHRISLGDTVSGTLANVDATDTYTFTTDPGQIIFVEHQVGACEVVLFIADSTGSLAVNSACNDIGPLTLVPGGEGRIEVGRRSAVSGDYRFHLIAVPPTTTAPITIGDTVTGQLETKGAVDVYTFTAAPGQVVVIEHQVGDCGATIDIADDSGKLAVGSACNDVGPFTLSKGGEYRIHVVRGSAETGDYRFRLRTG